MPHCCLLPHKCSPPPLLNRCLDYFVVPLIGIYIYIHILYYLFLQFIYSKHQFASSTLFNTLIRWSFSHTTYFERNLRKAKPYIVKCWWVSFVGATEHLLHYFFERDTTTWKENDVLQRESINYYHWFNFKYIKKNRVANCVYENAESFNGIYLPNRYF